MMSLNDIRDLFFDNYYKRIGFSEESSYFSMKHLKRKELLLLANKLMQKVPDRRNAKDHYNSFLRKKNKKSVKQSEIITYHTKNFDTVDRKSDIAEHPKTSHKLSKTIRSKYMKYTYEKYWKYFYC